MNKSKLKIQKTIFYHLVKISIGLSVIFLFQTVSGQSITISPSSASSIQTSRSINNIDLIKTGTNNTAGFRFYQSASLRGGLYYNDADNILNITHTPNMPGIVWNTDSQRAGIGVKLPEGRLHILTNSTDAVAHILIQENNDGDGGRLNFENYGVANKHWTLYGKNSNSAVPSTNAFNIYHTSFGNVAQFTGDGNTRMIGNAKVNGFTQLGSDAPSIKVRKYTGTFIYNSYTEFQIDIPFDKIISFTGHVKLTGFPYAEPHLIKPNEEQNNINYNLKIFQDGNDLSTHVSIGSGSNDWQGVPYTVYITYEE